MAKFVPLRSSRTTVSLTDDDGSVTGVVDGHAHRQGVIVLVRHGELRPAGVFQDPQLPIDLREREGERERGQKLALVKV